jgi:hypothetical protein
LEYHIPSDLLSATDGGGTRAGGGGELAAVKGHVAGLLALIAEAKQEELDAQWRRGVRKGSLAMLEGVVGRVAQDLWESRDGEVILLGEDGAARHGAVGLSSLSMPSSEAGRAFEEKEKRLAEEKRLTEEAAARPTDSADVTRMREHINTMLKREAFLNGRINAATELSRKKGTRGAVAVLKKKKLWEKEVAQLSISTYQMEQQIMMLEQKQEIVEGAFSSLQDDLEDAMEEMQELSGALGQCFGDEIEESELEDEFAALEEEQLDEQLLCLGAPCPTAAAAAAPPSTAPPTKAATAQPRAEHCAGRRRAGGRAARGLCVAGCTLALGCTASRARHGARGGRRDALFRGVGAGDGDRRECEPNREARAHELGHGGGDSPRADCS